MTTLAQLKVGARFRFTPDGPLWVLVDNKKHGLIASLDGLDGAVYWGDLAGTRYCSAVDDPEDAEHTQIYDLQ